MKAAKHIKEVRKVAETMSCEDTKERLFADLDSIDA